MLKTKKTFTKRLISLMLTLIMTLIFLPQLSQLKANAVTKYDLWLYDKQVTSANYNDILGNGSARYAPSTKTLYITEGVVDYKNNNYSAFSYAFPFIKSYINGLKINITGFIHAAGHAELYDQIYGFILYSDTTITGNGRLFIDGHHTIDVFGNSTLTIKDTEISINHMNRYFNNAMGISGNGDNTKLRIEHASVWSDSNPYYNTASISGFRRGIELVNTVFEDNDSKIAYVSGKSGISDGYAVVSAKDGSLKKSVNTKPTEPETSNEGSSIIQGYIMKASELRSYIDLNLEGINDAGTYSIQKKLQNNFVNKFVQLHNDHVTGKLLYLDDVKMRLFVSQSVKASITATLPRYYTDEQYVNAVVNFYLNGKISKNQAIEILESFFRNTALRIVIPGDFTLRPGIIDSHEIEIPIRETIERPWRTTID